MLNFFKNIFYKRLKVERDEIKLIDSFIQSFPLPMFFKNLDDKYLACNKAFEVIAGKLKQEIINKTSAEVWGIDQSKTFKEKDQELYCSGANQNYETVITTSTGIRKNVVFNKAIKYNENKKIIGLVGSIIDITDRIRVEKEIVLKSLVLDQIKDLVAITDFNGVLNFVNQAEILTLGYSKEELLGKTIQMFGEDAFKGATQKEILSKTIENGHWNGEVVNFSKDGKEIILNCRTQVIKDNEGKSIAISGVSTDITAFKRTQDELVKAKTEAEESELKFRMAFDFSGIGMAMVSLEKKFLRANRELCEIWGYSESELVGKSFLEITYHVDLKLGLEEIKKCIQGEINSFKVRKRYIRKSGEPIWMNLTVAVIRNIKNEPQFFVAQFENISLQVKYEQDLIAAKENAEESEMKFRTIFEKSPYGIVIINPSDASFLGFNDQVCSQLGYTREEFSKLTIFDIEAVETAEITSQKIQMVLENGNASFETKHRTKSGELIDVAVSAYLVDVNEKKYYHCIWRDITENKKNEQLLIEAKEIAERNEHSIKLQNAEIELNNQRVESLLRISQHQTTSIQELLDFALEEAINLTKSKIGYIYFYNETTQKFTLNTWSKEVMNECKVMDPQTQYDLDKTGCWGEAVRQRKPILINDYEAFNPYKKGTPEGHVALKKFLSIPVIIDERIVAVAGVANKNTNYNNSDIQQLTLLMDSVWKVAERITLVENLKLAKESAERGESALKKQNELFSVLLDNLTQGVFMVEAPTGKPILANKAAVRILGRGIAADASKENLAQVYQAFIADTNIPYPTEQMPILLGMSGQSVYIDNMAVQHPGGSLVNLEVFGTPVKDSEGKIWASLVSFTDITERKKIQKELILAKEKAEESDRLKTAFLQNMSHEIRTPMNAIMGFSELLVPNFDNKSKLEQYAKIIGQRCDDLLVIINDILEIAKIESGLMPINIEKVDLNLLFLELKVFFIEHQKKMGKDEIAFDIKPIKGPSHLFIEIDKIKLKQIFINLIGNAFKFTSKGSIEGGCVAINEKEIVFYVSDTGIGIPKDKQQLIFDRFMQVDPGVSRIYGGTGLGLSIVKGLIELLKGKIWLESEINKGTSFYFSLPCNFTKGNAEKEMATLAAPNDYFNKTKTILVVEDDLFNAKIIHEILAEAGLNVVVAENGLSSIKLTTENEFDLVLMDIGLPDISGYEAIKKIKEIRPELKIIVQSAYASNEDMNNAIKCGCVDFISKPMKNKALLEMVKKHLI